MPIIWFIIVNKLVISNDDFFLLFPLCNIIKEVKENTYLLMLTGQQHSRVHTFISHYIRVYN